MSKASRDKGKQGEREAAGELSNLLGRHVFRNLGQERDGGCDITLHSTAGPIAIQVKRQERCKILPWLRQARDDAAEGHLPAVMWRQSGAKWVVAMDLEQWANIIREIQD